MKKEKDLQLLKNKIEGFVEVVKNHPHSAKSSKDNLDLKGLGDLVKDINDIKYTLLETVRDSFEGDANALHCLDRVIMCNQDVDNIAKFLFESNNLIDFLTDINVIDDGSNEIGFDYTAFQRLYEDNLTLIETNYNSIKDLIDLAEKDYSYDKELQNLLALANFLQMHSSRLEYSLMLQLLTMLPVSIAVEKNVEMSVERDTREDTFLDVAKSLIKSTLIGVRCFKVLKKLVDNSSLEPNLILTELQKVTSGEIYTEDRSIILNELCKSIYREIEDSNDFEVILKHWRKCKIKLS